MHWTEQEYESRRKVKVTPEREAVLDEVKRDSHPIVINEVPHRKGITPLKFQPVRSPGNFEAEFAMRDNDLVVHVWPWLHHEKERRGEPRPAFKPGLPAELRKAFKAGFDERTVIVAEDRDMNAYFIRVNGLGKNQFWRDLAIKALTSLHDALS